MQWSILIVLTTVYNYIFVPFQKATKGSIISNSVLDLGFFLDLGFDSILIFDLLFRFNVGYTERGQFINDKAHVRKNYLQTDFKRHLLLIILPKRGLKINFIQCLGWNADHTRS